MNTSASTFTDYAQGLRGRIDEALRGYSSLGEGCPEELGEAIRHSLLAPGKRLRPMLTLMAAEACGETTHKALAAACAVEMVHTYSLVHDDLPAMDDDDLRRGRPTSHKKFGEATAILVGDALLALAIETLAGEVQPPARAAACCAILARAAGPCRMVGGQADDLKADRAAGGIDALESIHHRKTGAMFVAALRIGATVAGAGAAETEALETYGVNLGLAFQITDDLLDVRGQESDVGKRVGKDAGRGKLTFPGLLGIEESARRADRLIADACAALGPLGTPAGGLEALARYVLERSR